MDLVVVGMVPLSALLFLGAPDILETWVGPGFRSSVPVLCLLCGTLLLFSIRLVASSVLTETRFVRAGVLITAVYLGLHFGLSVLWLPTWGVVGPAMGSVISQAIGLLLTLLVVIRLGILDVRSLMSSRVLVLTLAAILATTLLALGRENLPPWPWALLAICAGGLYALAGWRWALPASFRTSLLGGLR